MMDVSKYMCFGLYFRNFFKKLAAASVNSIISLIQYLKRRPMSNQKVNIVGHDRPNLFSPCVMILESPIKEKWLVWRGEYLQSFNFYELMLKISAMLFEPLELQFGIKFFMWVTFWLVLKRIVLDIINEIVIASDDYLVFVGKFIQKLDKSVQLTSIAVLGEVSCMDKDISLGQSRNFEIFMQIMSVTHSQDSQFYGIVHLSIILCIINLTIQKLKSFNNIYPPFQLRR